MFYRDKKSWRFWHLSVVSFLFSQLKQLSMIYYQTIDFLDVAAKDIVFLVFQVFFSFKTFKRFLGNEKKNFICIFWIKIERIIEDGESQWENNITNTFFCSIRSSWFCKCKMPTISTELEKSHLILKTQKNLLVICKYIFEYLSRRLVLKSRKNET